MLGKDDRGRGVDIVGFINQGVIVEGKMTFDKTVRLEGTFRGEIVGTGTLVIGEQGLVEAEIKADVVIVTGVVRGVVEASSRVEIKAPGKVFGEIKTHNLIIGDGAVFEGNSVMLSRDKVAKPFDVKYKGAETEKAG